MENELIIRTSLTPDYLKKILVRGFCLSIIGSMLLIGASIFLPEPLLNKWGWLLYFSALILITIGLLPYRKLSKLQNKPNEIRLIDRTFQFWTKGKCLLSTSVSDINSLSYRDENLPGIEISFKKNYPFPQNLKSFQVVQGKETQQLVFLYFSKRSFNELMNWLNDSEEG